MTKSGYLFYNQRSKGRKGGSIQKVDHYYYSLTSFKMRKLVSQEQARAEIQMQMFLPLCPQR